LRTGRFNDAARIATAAGVSPEAVTQYINENLTGLNLPGEIPKETVSEVMRLTPVESSMAENVAELMSRARLEAGGIKAGTEIEARAAEEASGEVAGGETRGHPFTENFAHGRGAYRAAKFTFSL
jgi:hypothetical protein